LARARVVLAFDFGSRRIGVATGDTVSRSAAPRRTLMSPPSGPDWTAVLREIASVGPDLLLVGAPYNDDGTPSRVAAAADRFAAELAHRSGLAVERIDERYSSVEAASVLKDRRASGEMRRRLKAGDIDSAAAAVILGSWLQQQNGQDSGI
jgi:putative Holliday junction resolvase